MITPPRFEVSRITDIEYWWPYVAEILDRHGLKDTGRALAAGADATYPTFLYGDVVVKLFGCSSAWRKSFAAERAALVMAATDPEILAPGLLAEGRLYDDLDPPWPYLVMARVPGVSWRKAGLSTEQQRSVAAELGRQVRRLHALRPVGVLEHEDWAVTDVAAAAARSSLPPHLVAQVDEYLTRLEPFDRVLVHGDLIGAHAFVERGRLTGIIDWGDAMLTDRHYELIQIQRDVFDCDKALLRVFLEACGWPMSEGFAHQSLGLALHRQAIGLVQHRSMDVFEPVAARFPLGDISSLEELAGLLFSI